MAKTLKVCPACGTTLLMKSNQKCCGDACRQKALKMRVAAGAAAANAAAAAATAALAEAQEAAVQVAARLAVEQAQAAAVQAGLQDQVNAAAAAAAAVSTWTRDQRDAAGRKRAIDLDDDAVTTPPQRVRAADDDADLTTRVAKAHSLMQPQVDAAYRALLQPHFSAYAADEIDAAELDQRKQRAHEEAASQHQPALSLNRAHSTYESASRAAAAAYEAYEAAAAAAAAAKLSLESELRAIEGP